jgi:hypothetical protein
MPTDKDLKRLVRARMQKTGESYTAARSQILNKPVSKLAPSAAGYQAKPAPEPDFEKLTAMSNAVISKKTGRTWAQWVEALDWHKAHLKPHREIADLVSTEFGVPDWWTQAVTVGYERIKGIRAIGQRRDGSYEANKSKTFAVPVKKLFDAWSKAATRKKWLDEPGITIRSATSPKSMRIKWSDGSVVLLNFLPKGKSKSAVAVQHTKLPDKATADRFKQYWSERLGALVATLVK